MKDLLFGALQAHHDGHADKTGKGYEAALPECVKPSEGGSGSSLPKGGAPHQQLVTDADGVAKWEDRTHFFGEETVFDFGIVPDVPYDEQKFNGGTWERNNPNYITITYPADESYIGTVPGLVGAIVTNYEPGYCAEYAINEGDIDENGNLSCVYAFDCRLMIDNATGVITLNAPVYLGTTVMPRYQPKSIAFRTYIKIPNEFIRFNPIVFKINEEEGTYRCNMLSFHDVSEAIRAGAPMWVHFVNASDIFTGIYPVAYVRYSFSLNEFGFKILDTDGTIKEVVRYMEEYGVMPPAD